jgi:AcrR family transcriptional regulator
MAKKQAIMQAALELFAEQGIEATTVQQITERSGISKGAFYLSFKSKEELILGIIEQVFGEIASEIDQAVTETSDDSRLLYRYFYASFQSFRKHRHFAMMLMKEPAATFHPQLIERLRLYDRFWDQITDTVVRRQFPRAKEALYPDLIMLVRSFLHLFAEYIFLDPDDLEIDLDRLCRSLVEKTAVIAEHATIAFLTPDDLAARAGRAVPGKEEMLRLIAAKREEVREDAIVGDSLRLLQEHIETRCFSEAIVQGLLRNIRTNVHCRWLAHLVQSYLQGQNGAS